MGEDWTDVELSLVAGAPQSFVHQLSQPYYAHRPVVPLPEGAMTAPQTHEAALNTKTGAAGTLVGRIADTNGSALPGARIYITNGAQTYNATSDGSGRFQIAGVVAGTYQMNVTLGGFTTANISGLHLGAGQTLEQNATLQVGALTESVSVVAAPRMVQTSAAALGGGDSTLSEYLTVSGAEAVPAVFRAGAGRSV